ncbi:MAG TPA: helix-turn-helix transcriptional regulator [Chitinophagaceae bacterium]|nr:helix-turn-helix transcriptional regulator [Chitinophagaceae bacterium]
MLDKNIKHLRQLDDLSQSSFGERFGASRSMIDSYERGNAKPSSDTLKTIAAYYGITIDALLTKDLSNKTVFRNAMCLTSTTDSDLLQAKDEVIAELRRQVKSQQETIHHQQRLIENLTRK